MDEYRILSQASHKGANAHNHGADQRAEFISVHLIYPFLCFFCQVGGYPLLAYSHECGIEDCPKYDSV